MGGKDLKNICPYHGETVSDITATGGKVEELINEVKALTDQISSTFIDRNTHWQHHQVVGELFGKREQIDEHKNHHNWLSRWFKRTEKATNKVFYWMVLAIAGLVVIWFFGGFMAWFKTIATHIPVVGGFNRRIEK